MKNNIVPLVIVAIVVGAVAFFAGMKYQSSQNTNGFGQNQANRLGGAGGQGRFGRNGGTRPVSGDIVSSDATSITVKMSDGTTKIVILSNSTMINKAAVATKADLKTGERVAVFGTTNSDGSMTAQSISINPEFGRGNGSPQGSPVPSSP